jgi:hypothetical protein
MIDAKEETCLFEKWTMAHGHFVRMGGFVVELHNDTPSIVESTKCPETVSVRVQHFLDLVNNTAEPRFDLLQEASKADIKQVHDALATNVLMSFLLRLLPFAYYSIRRRHRALEISPLEVFAVAYIFMAVCIQIFWWDKPQFLRKGVILKRGILCQLTKDFGSELSAAAKVTPVATAYPLILPARLGFVQWHSQDDNHINLRIHETYRDLIVTSIAVCHATIMLLPQWGLRFDTAGERIWWRMPLKAMTILSSIFFFLMSLDLVGTKLSERPGWSWFRKIWGAALCRWKREDAPPGAAEYVR